MFSAFQHSGYQNNSYQINSGKNVVEPWTGGGPIDGYYERIKRYRADQERLAKELKESEDRLKLEKQAKAEADRLAREQEETLISVKDQEIIALQALADELELQRLEQLIIDLKAQIWMARLQEEDALILLLLT